MNIKKEVWKDVEGYEGFYQISNLGRVKSLKQKSFSREKIMKIIVNPKFGYAQLNFRVDNKIKCFKIHRLVAIAFIPNPENKPDVNHIDGNKLNNCVTNLEWCSKSENMIHAFKNGLCVFTEEKKALMLVGLRKKICKKVLQYDKLGNLIKEHDSVEEAAMHVGGNQSNVSNCCNKKSGYNTVKGFVFKYK